MKHLALTTLLLTGPAHAKNTVDTQKKYLQITEGLLMGAIQAEGLTDIAHCVQDGQHILQDAERAYQDF